MASDQSASQLGEWGEAKVASVVRKHGGKAFKNTDTYDTTDDLWVDPGVAEVLNRNGVKNAVQVKAKSKSSWRRCAWSCYHTKRSGGPREEHGLELSRFRNYQRRGACLVFAERSREVAKGVVREGEAVVVCKPDECDMRVGACPRQAGGKKVPWVYFDRSKMTVLS